MIERILVFGALTSLCACGVSESSPPSLAHREIEGIMNQPMRAIAPVESASDSALAARIAELVDQAEAGQADFAAALPRAQSAVGSAGGIESESWIAAQLSLSALDSARSDTTAALAELDTILAQQTSSGQPAETERLIAARERVAALYGSQAQSYATLLSRLQAR